MLNFDVLNYAFGEFTRRGNGRSNLLVVSFIMLVVLVNCESSKRVWTWLNSCLISFGNTTYCTSWRIWCVLLHGCRAINLSIMEYSSFQSVGQTTQFPFLTFHILFYFQLLTMVRHEVGPEAALVVSLSSFDLDFLLDMDLTDSFASGQVIFEPKPVQQSFIVQNRSTVSSSSPPVMTLAEVDSIMQQFILVDVPVFDQPKEFSFTFLKFQIFGHHNSTRISIFLRGCKGNSVMKVTRPELSRLLDYLISSDCITFKSTANEHQHYGCRTVPSADTLGIAVLSDRLRIHWVTSVLQPYLRLVQFTNPVKSDRVILISLKVPKKILNALSSIKSALKLWVWVNSSIVFTSCRFFKLFMVFRAHVFSCCLLRWWLGLPFAPVINLIGG